MSSSASHPVKWKRAGRLRSVMAGALLALACCGRAQAVQILVNPGDDWQAKALKARPGDEIVLMPGRHRPGSFDRLCGEMGAPITIRGATGDKPSIITAQLDGIRVREGAHLIIKDLQIIGGSASGIWIAAPVKPPDGTPAPQPAAIGPTSPPAVRTEHASNILIDNVTISKVGPRGQRHGVYLCGFSDVRIIGVSVEGWGGSAIELVACNDVAISRCTFKGIKDHSQYCGIRARAGCDRVAISESRFENAGDIAVCMGGKSTPEEFIPPLGEDTPKDSVFEAARVSVEQTVIFGGLCPVAMIHAVDCVVRSTTIVRPRRCVLALLSQNADPRLTVSARNLFGGNLVVWHAGDVTKLVEMDKTIDPAAFMLETNMWWSNDSPERRNKLGPLPGSPEMQDQQIFDVDPNLDASLRPTTPAAGSYGADV